MPINLSLLPLFGSLLFSSLPVLSDTIPSTPEANPRVTLRVYTVTKIDRNLNLTGKLDDPLWRRAQPASLTDVVTGQAVEKSAEVRVLYNEQYLYIGFNCQADYVWGRQTKRDSPVFGEQCVECFLSPTGLSRLYYELDLSPRNVLFDAAVLNGKQFEKDYDHFFSLVEYDCKGATKTAVDGEMDKDGAKGWSAEYAIPFASLVGPEVATPKRGELWRGNFYRVDSRDPGEGKQAQLNYAAWSPTGAREFHLPAKFGWIKFD